MTMKNFTDITILLDRSGSMATIKNDMEGALKTFIAEQQALDDEHEYKTTLTFIEFDHEYKVVVRGEKLKNFELPEFKPRGMTALLDAGCSAIKVWPGD